MSRGIDPDFEAFGYRELGDAALQAAADRGATYADLRFERQRTQHIHAHDRDLQGLTDSEQVGYCVRVIADGAWGFAYGVDPKPALAADAAERAVELARALAPLNSEPVELADEPVYQDTWISSYAIDPFSVSDGDKVEFLLNGNGKLLAGGVDHADVAAAFVLENKYFASLAGSRITQQRVRQQVQFHATKVDPESGSFETMRTVSLPVGNGWEYIAEGYDFDAELERLPEQLDEKLHASSIEPGRYDLVIDPTNLWLTIHESIGHSTELDRVLGYEANYAGTSFATLDKLGSLAIGSSAMNVTGDRVAEHGLATIGYDDEGVAAQTWPIISEGVLVGYQLNRQMAAKQGFGRSNGCAFSDGPDHVPLQRMPNVSLKPAANGTTLQDLIGSVEDGLYVVGDKSWSIDMQRYNFQFTGQRFYRIRNGTLAGQVKDVAYQATTTEFWNALESVGGAGTYLLAGALNCGKGQPGQIAPVSHGCPPGLFRQINILNTASEGS